MQALLGITSAGLRTTFATAELNAYPKNYFQVWREKIAAVTLSDVNRLAASVLDRDKYTIAILRGK